MSGKSHFKTMIASAYVFALVINLITPSLTAFAEHDQLDELDQDSITAEELEEIEKNESSKESVENAPSPERVVVPKPVEEEVPPAPPVEEAAPVDAEPSVEEGTSSDEEVIDEDDSDAQAPEDEEASDDPEDAEEPTNPEEGEVDDPDEGEEGTEGEEGEEPAIEDEDEEQADDGAEPEEADAPEEIDVPKRPTTPKENTPAIDTLNDEYPPVSKRSYPAVKTDHGKLSTGGMRIGINLETEAFIATIGEQARYIGQENDLYASVMIAQAVLESGSGTSVLSKAPNYNLFGIKGSYEGESVRMKTQEDNGWGAKYTIYSNFRAYPNYQASLEDYAQLIRDKMGTFYAGAWKQNADTPLEACNYLQGRYATDTQYAQKLMNIIETYDLERFDEPLDKNSAAKAALEAEITSQIGVPYLWGGTTPDGFDCSGLVQHTYAEALDYNLPRVAASQALVGADVLVDVDYLQTGDLLFFQKPNGRVHHVAMYLGDGYYIHAPRTGKHVTVQSLEDWTPNFAKRVLLEEYVVNLEGEIVPKKSLSKEELAELDLVEEKEENPVDVLHLNTSRNWV